MRRTMFVIVLAILVLFAWTSTAYAALSGAIFTTTVNGSRVNANIYQAKEDVYLDGGPGMNAPQGAAGLPDGHYYFQVTDPSGKELLSLDPIQLREIEVLAGIIVKVYPVGPIKVDNKWWSPHLTGFDIDHPPALTVQLMPYKNTPNPGGVYKVWVTPVDKYAPGQGFFGFLPAWSKTDNYKVKGRCIPPKICVEKFHDLNWNGVWDAGEPSIAWKVSVTDPAGVVNDLYLPGGGSACICNIAPAGMWCITEDMPSDWFQTVVYVDGVKQTPLSATATVTIAGTSAESHTVVFGNALRACVSGFKFYDADGDGVKDAGESPIAGWKMTLSGTNCRGESVSGTKLTDEYGYATWCGLLPGTYTVTEATPTDPRWVATTPTSGTGAVGQDGSFVVEFGNCYKGFACFNTKGYWHNKNGLAELTPADIAYVNGLAPYKANPFDGKDANGNPVPAAKGDWGETVAPAGTWQAEVSAYLVAPNAGGDARIQLGQQLLAFIFNVQHRLGGVGAAIGMPDGSWAVAGDVIDDAVDAWCTGGVPAGCMASLLDAYNNSCSVPYISAGPGPISFP